MEDTIKSRKQYHPTFGSNLKKIREDYGLSQKELAELMGLPREGAQSISRYEAGEREPSLLHLCRIADIFGISLDVLLDRRPAQFTDKITMYLRKENKELTPDDYAKIMKLISVFIHS